MSKIFIEESTLTSIGDAIREKTGKSELISPLDMPTEIEGIQTGGGEDLFTKEDFTFSGNLSDFNAGGGMDSLLTKAKTANLLSFKDITALNNAFSFSQFDFEGVEIHFAGDKNTAITSSGMGRLFYNFKGKKLPRFTGKYPAATGMVQYSFSYMSEVIDFDGVFDDVDWSYRDANYQASNYNAAMNWFINNYKMRHLPPSSVLKHFDSTNTWGNLYKYSFENNYCLKEIVDLPVFDNQYMRITLTPRSNICKHFTFETNEDGSPIVVNNWAYNQTIDLSTSFGFNGSASYYEGAKVINSDATYEQYKNDEDAYPLYDRYSFYNHDAAVETLNSLPDASGITGYTNTIKFKGSSGSSTDGGAINTLTDEEIAVAAAKGWTVSFV